MLQGTTASFLGPSLASAVDLCSLEHEQPGLDHVSKKVFLLGLIVVIKDIPDSKKHNACNLLERVRHVALKPGWNEVKTHHENPRLGRCVSRVS